MKTMEEKAAEVTTRWQELYPGGAPSAPSVECRQSGTLRGVAYELRRVDGTGPSIAPLWQIDYHGRDRAGCHTTGTITGPCPDCLVGILQHWIAACPLLAWHAPGFSSN